MKLSFPLFLLLTGSLAPTVSGACDGNVFTWQLFTDNYGSETSWTLSTENGVDLVLSGDGYENNNAYGGQECIDDGCYTFVMLDSYGDGLCCSYYQGSYGEGTYSFALNGVNEIESGGNFGYSETTYFCTTASPTCVDSGTSISYGGAAYTCAQVVAYDSCSNPVASSHCPFSCSTCEESACLDSQASWIVSGGTYNCDDVAGLTSDSVPYTIEAACAVVGSTCRATCGYCN